MELKGKVALITGGAQRLGRAMALKLAGAGAHVVIHYRTSAAQAAATVEAIRSHGGQAAPVQGDLTQVAEIERVVDQATVAWGRLDILINNAAIFYRTPLGTVTEAQWDALLATNLKAPFFCAQAAADYLRQEGGGVIINMVDTGVYIAWKEYIPYLVAKAGIEHMTYGLAKALAPEVRVNGIAPGPALLEEGHTPPERERAIRGTLLKRLGGAEAIAETVLYLVQADFVTGVVIPVDGGQRWR